MKWHVISRIGESDSFIPDLGDGDPRIFVPLDRPADPWRIQENILGIFEEAKLPAPTGIARDLLHLGIAIFAADIRVSRGFGMDKWQRAFKLHLPVSDPTKWNKAKTILIELLSFLTGDSWEIEFRQGELLNQEQTSKPREATVPTFDAVCLFSGGLDSLVGAIDRLKDGQNLVFVGHRGAGLTNTFQNKVLAKLSEHYEGKFVPLMFRIQPPKRIRRKQTGNMTAKIKEVDISESTMRARSMLFFSLGVAVAETLGTGITLSAAENGLISLNVPLTMARQGSLSTRTTHPHVIDSFRRLLVALRLTTKIEMPYRFQTKGEMLKNCKDQRVLAATTPLTMSCSHPEAGRWRGKPGDHCGYCVPCIIRRASTVEAKVRDAKYVIDPRKTPPSHTSQRGRDLRAFEIAVERYFEQSREDNLASVIGTGPIVARDIPGFVNTYRSGMEEVARFLRIARPKVAATTKKISKRRPKDAREST